MQGFPPPHFFSSSPSFVGHLYYEDIDASSLHLLLNQESKFYTPVR